MTPEVEAAVGQIVCQYSRRKVFVAEDQTGGACVIVEGEPLGPPFEQSETWIGFHITNQCPYADTYPHFVRPDLKRIDRAALGEGFSGGHFPAPGVVKNAAEMPSRPAIQVSRRSNHRDLGGFETPLIKLLKVLRWLRSR